MLIREFSNKRKVKKSGILRVIMVEPTSSFANGSVTFNLITKNGEQGAKVRFALGDLKQMIKDFERAYNKD